MSTAHSLTGTAAEKTELEDALRAAGVFGYRIKRIHNGLRLCLDPISGANDEARAVFTAALNAAGYSLIRGVPLKAPLSWNQPHEIFLRARVR